jgi:hypothetical protein
VKINVYCGVKCSLSERYFVPVENAASRIQDRKKNGCSEPYDGLMAISGTFFSTLSVE